MINLDKFETLFNAELPAMETAAIQRFREHLQASGEKHLSGPPCFSCKRFEELLYRWMRERPLDEHLVDACIRGVEAAGKVAFPSVRALEIKGDAKTEWKKKVDAAVKDGKRYEEAMLDALGDVETWAKGK